MFRLLTFLLPLSFTHAATIDDFVWLDSNRNGIQDEGEKPQSNIGLKLYFDKNADGFPERLLARTKSDQNGRYSFSDLKPGLYSVGLEVNSLPEDIYEATRLHAGPSDKDNDLNRNTLRTQPFKIEADDQTLENIADVGLLPGSAEVSYLGKENYVSLTGIQVECDIYLYQGLKLRFPAHHGRVEPAVIKQWMKWLKLTDSIQQQLFVAEGFLDGGIAREPGSDQLDPSIGHRPLAYAGGTYASSPRSEGDDVGKVLLEKPDDFHRHWTLIYEMGRVHPGPWHFRATWPPYTFMNAHFQTALVLHHLGGDEALKVPNPYNSLSYDFTRTGLDFWTRSDAKFAETFQPDFADRGVELFIGDERNYLWGGTININILFHIYLNDGFEKMVEVLQNMARKQRLVSTAAQAGLDFSEAINEATDGKYAETLIKDWGMPAPKEYAFRTLGKDTGPFVEQDEYRWDFIPFNSEEVAEDHAPLTERNLKGYVRWKKAPDFATRSRDGQLGQASARDQTIVGMGHDYTNMNGDHSFADYQAFLSRKPSPTLTETRSVGQLKAEETADTKEHYLARWTGTLHVPETRDYQFKFEADDFAFLLIDGTQVATCRNTKTEQTLTLEKGSHPFELIFGEIGGAARFSFDHDPALKFTGEKPNSQPSFHRFDDTNLEGGTPVTQGSFTLQHQLKPAVWQITITFSNIAETKGISISAEGETLKKDLTLPQHALHEETFEIEVKDGTLDLSFWNKPSAINTIGLSSLRVKKLRDLPN
ncbi:MAG: SdrD B-like domain-containing protein [Akkermansiaceae bacterium]